MMRRRLTISALVVAALGASALAHSGATGIVKERMDAMVTLGDAAKEISPMMRGLAPYDAARVRALADVMVAQSGDALTARFPEGSGGMPSEALPVIWQDWERFGALAAELEALATALGAAAEVPLAGGDARPLTGALPGAGELQQTSPDVLFLTIARGCSSCHETYRLKSE